MARKIGIGAEGLMHKNFASLIRGYEKIGLLKCLFWTYNASGEKRTITTGSLLKAKGLQRGMADYIFFKEKQAISCFEPEYELVVIFIEFKAGKNKQTDSQVDFQNKFKDLQNVSYYTCYSVKEAEEALIKEKVIKQNNK